jgi:hypothetical protein
VKIAGDVKTTDFPTRVVKSGSSIDSGRPATAAARLAAANRRADQRVATVGDATPATPGKHGANGTGPAERQVRVGGPSED